MFGPCLISRTQVLYHLKNICSASCCHHWSSSCCQESLSPNCLICSPGKNELGLRAKARCDYYSKEWFTGPHAGRRTFANAAVWTAATTYWRVADRCTKWHSSQWWGEVLLWWRWTWTLHQRLPQCSHVTWMEYLLAVGLGPRCSESDFCSQNELWVEHEARLILTL